MSIIIPRDEIDFNFSSYVDPNARVFEWQGKIYRAMTKDKESFYKEFLRGNLSQDLQKQHWLIESDITDYLLNDYAFVVRHRKIPFLSYCVEWSAVMLKDAALRTLKICKKLSGFNLSLQDAYPWNVYFDFTQPIFVDLGSIIPAPDDLIWTPYQQFCQFFLYPLYLASSGRQLLARRLLFDYIEGVREEDIVLNLPFRYKLTHPRIISRIIIPFWFEKMFPAISKKLYELISPLTKKIISKIDIVSLRFRFFDQLIREVRALKIPIKNSQWVKYYGKDFSCSLNLDNAWNAKQKVVAQVLDQLRPKSVLDFACNRGWFSMLAASKGCSVIAFDKDSDCISQLYFDAKEEKLDILPLIMDVLNPTPAFGWNTAQFPSAVDRLKCDMVFAFALIHHLVFKQFQNFSRIALTIKEFTREWALVEFPLPDDEMVKEMWLKRCSWYNLDNFMQAMNAHFRLVSTYNSYPSTRKLLLYKKHENSH